MERDKSLRPDPVTEPMKAAAEELVRRLRKEHFLFDWIEWRGPVFVIGSPMPRTYGFADCRRRIKRALRGIEPTIKVDIVTERLNTRSNKNADNEKR